MAYFRKRIVTGYKYTPSLKPGEVLVLIAFGLSITLFISTAAYGVYLILSLVF